LNNIYLATVTENNNIAKNTYQMKLQCPEIAVKVIPGQFVHVRCSELLSPLLRRPFSIADTDNQKKTIIIIYKVIGEGTLLLSKKKPRDVLDIIGPLGRGFPLPPSHKKSLLLAGGLGTAPILFLAKRAAQALKHRNTNISRDKIGLAVIGFPNKQTVFGAEFLKSCGFEVMVMTDDGSYGVKGNPAAFVSRNTGLWEKQIIYSCGPIPMLSRIKDLVDSHNVPAYFSLEERMACGIGACLGCAVKSSDIGYKKVCSDGPVFKSEEVVF
jgi:dihydroorotate dehydrogenase electron transfer subunit